MRKSLLFLLLFALACSHEEEQQIDEKLALSDSILEKSSHSLDTATIVSHASDSLTKQQIIKVVKEIRNLEGEVRHYKEEKLHLLTAEKIIYRVDTVYIETKKNFWGKEKTSTSVKSDSTVTEKVDTTTKEIIDTLQILIVPFH